MALRTRPATGQVAYPMVLIVGETKSGKSWQAYRLSGSELIGRTFAFELGERTADEYAPLGDFEVVEHNGTRADLLDQVRAATAEPQVDGKPNCIVLDSGTALWDLHKHRADAKARSTRRAREALAADPDAEIETGMTAWTAVKDEYWELMNLLRAWDGITIITARIDIVVRVENGRPVPGQTVRSIQIEKGTPYQMTAIVEVDHPNPPRLTEVQSLNVSIPDGGLDLPADDALEHLVFRILGAGGRFENGLVVNPALGVPYLEAMSIVMERATTLVGEKDAAEVAAAAWDSQGLRGMPEITTEQLAAALKSMEAKPAEEAPEAGPAAPEAAPAAPDEPAGDQVAQPTLDGESAPVEPEPQPEPEPAPKPAAKSRAKAKPAAAPTLDQGEPAA